MLQFIPGLVSIHHVGGVAYVARIGGFLSGVLLAVLLRRRHPTVAPLPPTTVLW